VHLFLRAHAEMKYLSPSEIDSGYRLACQAHIGRNDVVVIPPESRMGVRRIALSGPCPCADKPRGVRDTPKDGVGWRYRETDPRNNQRAHPKNPELLVIHIPITKNEVESGKTFDKETLCYFE